MALNINGTTGISGVDGSNSSPAIQGADSNTGVSFGTDTVNIVTGGTIRAIVDSSGNFGIGITPDSKLHVYGASSAFAKIETGDGGTNPIIMHKNPDRTWHAGLRGDTSDYYVIRDATASANRFVIDASGNVGIGTVQPNNADSADGGLQITPNISNGASQIAFKRANTGNTSYAIAFTNGSTGVGSISYTNGGTAYNTSSDYRLKENVIPLSDGITRLKTLKPYRFNFIVDANTTVDGFLAHEVTAVPEAITGTKDEVDSDNKPVYQGIDQSKLVPLLTAALQEAIAKIETLETKVAALEAG
jgi:hypothetical protein